MSCAAITSANDPLNDCGGNTTGKVNVRSYCVMVVMAICRMRIALEPVELVQRQRARQLPRAIGSEIEEDDAVAVANRSDRLVVRVDDRARLDELVRDARLV